MQIQLERPQAKEKHPEAQAAHSSLPEIPSKRYFTIGEVSKLSAVKPHVLRYWEQEFEMLKPSKRRGNRRYYQRDDVVMIRKIRELLYFQGFTIQGARLQLKAAKANTAKQSNADIVSELYEILAILDA